MARSISAGDVERLATKLRQAEGDVHQAESLTGNAFPHYEYPATVTDLFAELGEPPWVAYDYDPPTDRARLTDAECIARADIDELKRLLTAASHGERFCDGWWITALELGSLHRIVQRMRSLADDSSDGKRP